jgi:hypothetical protein
VVPSAANLSVTDLSRNTAFSSRLRSATTSAGMPFGPATAFQSTTL